MTTGDDYDRGHVAGGIDARLADHDNHFKSINGQLVDINKSLQALTLSVQRLGDSADSDRRTVVTTAKALKDAVDAQRASVGDRWSPWQKGIALIGGVAALVGLLAFIAANT